MLFNSYAFVIFFVIVFSLYWMFHRHYKIQNIILLVASYVFYGWWDYRFLFLLVVCTLVAYCFSLLIDRGRITFKQYLTISGVLLASAILCTTVQWSAVRLLGAGASVRWNNLFPYPIQAYWILGLSLLSVGTLGICLYGFPRFQKADPRVHLTICIVINLVVLGVFKYFNFFVDSFVSFWNTMGLPVLPEVAQKIILPIGISFFTFQAISYTVDVYRKQIPATDSLVEIATFKAFFPQLVAGPIERGAHLVPQFQKPRCVNRESFKEGIWLIFWGLYKKIVIADNLALIVNNTFGPYDKLQLTTVPEDGIRCLLAVYAFAIQIYCDFSGYTDIARGVAKLMGFELLLNFNLPYFAKTPSDFWKRWHISLSSWLRDYLYISLGGNRKGPFLTYMNLLITMLLGGLWHGASWTFVAWGLFQGGILVIYRFLGFESPKRSNWITSLIQWVIMFHLVCFGWLLFRAQNVETIRIFSVSILGHFQGSPEAWSMLKDMIYYSWFLVLFQFIQYFGNQLQPLPRMHWIIKIPVWVIVIMSLLTLSEKAGQEFIYFAF